jgi:HSP20 family protein
MAERNVERSGERMRRLVQPRTTVSEQKDGRLQVVVEMPGVRKDDLEIKVENSELRIEARRDASPERRYLLRERAEGDFLRMFTLDETVDPTKIDAVLEKGILTLTLDLKEQVKPRTIRVRAE